MPAATRIVVNPNAGSAGEIAELKATLRRRPDTEVRFSAKKGDAEELAREALRNGVRTVVAAGGDGTLNEVLNGLAEGLAAGRAGVRLGLLPLGTGNDFARSIGVPADLDAALALLDAGRTQWIDVAAATAGGRCRYFLNMSAGGLSGQVSEKAGDAKERWGPLAYMRAALDVLPERTAFPVDLELNGAETLHLEIYSLIVSNGHYVAAGIPAAPAARLDDGLLDLLILPAASLPQIALLVPQILLGRHMESDLLIYRKVTRLEIRSSSPMVFNVDGEVLDEAPSRIEVLPRALEMVVGDESP